MATALNTTPARATEDVNVYTPTQISKLFSTLLGTLAVAIEADRDIEDVDVSDPAFDGWLEDAERAWDEVIDLRRALLAAPVTRGEDKPLKMMSFLVHIAMGSEHPEELHAVQRFAESKPRWLRCDSTSATAQRVNAMLRQGRVLLRAIGGLEQFQPVLDLDDLPDGMSEAWPDAA